MEHKMLYLSDTIKYRHYDVKITSILIRWKKDLY